MSFWITAKRRFATFAIAMLSTGNAASAQDGLNSKARTSPPFKNEKIVDAPDGTKAVLVRWAVGTRDNIATLRIPLPYAPLAGASSFSNNEPNLRQPFMTQWTFNAMLWDMNAVPNNGVSGRARNNLVFGMIESIYFGSKERDEAQQLKIRAGIQLQGLQRNFYRTKFDLQIGEKGSRFGLRRIGAIHNLAERTPVGLNDFYFVGDQPTDSSDFMSCTDEAVPDDPPPGRHENPGCQHWFALPELSATVQVIYRRRHLAEWHEIKRRVRTLILSWKSGGGNER